MVLCARAAAARVYFGVTYMVRVFRLAAASFVVATLLAAPAWAERHYNCVVPFEPVIPNAKQASQAEMDDARLDVIGFLATSDMYQNCLVLTVKALSDPTLREVQIKNVEPLIKQNQDDKCRIGTAWNNAVADYETRINGAPPATNPPACPTTSPRDWD